MMEHFRYLPEYQVLVCIPCGHAVPPAYLDTHLKGHRKEWLGLDSTMAISVLKKQLQEFTLADPSQQQIQIPSPSSLALPGLPVEEGIGCTQCQFVTRSEGWMQKHVRTHQLTPRRQGRPRKTKPTIALTQPQAGSDLWEKVYCQRFFPSGPQSRFFRVAPLLEPTTADLVDPIRAQIYEQIRQCEQKEKEYNQVITTDRDYSEYSPWLEKTRWRDYIHGYTFTELTALAYMPDPVREPILQLWIRSLDTVVDQALESVTNHRINVFDQARINSFVDDAYRRPSHRPVFFHLKPSTDQRYRRIWKRLLCFVYQGPYPTNGRSKSTGA
ncbi:hypothetical protein N7532_004805 [Penicillium argentinense]|uniref:Uncharacterized protein n=1 Tax=Penicillium argentinense TaxID=1131581 RepID=A0A9W9FQ32_9EURO|nr:uncharacterized protein N7532_004805 [Penicillium argentinense]KAJ5104276.1 hypothetical protein N7532_004805 [Penicillium argentinense]